METDINELLTQVDYAFLDATFFEDGEISRPMSVPHPFVEESITRFKSLAVEEKIKSTSFIEPYKPSTRYWL